MGTECARLGWRDWTKVVLANPGKWVDDVTQTVRQRQRNRERWRDRETETNRERQRDTGTQGEIEAQRDTETETGRDSASTLCLVSVFYLLHSLWCWFPVRVMRGR